MKKGVERGLVVGLSTIFGVLCIYIQTDNYFEEREKQGEGRGGSKRKDEEKEVAGKRKWEKGLKEIC